MPDQLAEYSVVAARNLTFAEWTSLTAVLKNIGVSTVSRVTNNCPNCGTFAPPMWNIFIREEDKDLIAE